MVVVYPESPENIAALQQNLKTVTALQESLSKGLEDNRLGGIDKDDIGKLTWIDGDFLQEISGLTDRTPFPWAKSHRSEDPKKNLENVNQFVSVMGKLSGYMVNSDVKEEGSANLEKWYHKTIDDCSQSFLILDPQDDIGSKESVRHLLLMQSQVLLGRSVRRLLTQQHREKLTLPEEAREETIIRFRSSSKDILSKTMRDEHSHSVLEKIRQLLRKQPDWTESGLPLDYRRMIVKRDLDAEFSLPMSVYVKTSKKVLASDMSSAASREMAQMKSPPSSSEGQNATPTSGRGSQPVTSTIVKARSEADKLDYKPTYDGKGQAEYSSKTLAVLNEYHQHRIQMREGQTPADKGDDHSEQERILEYYDAAFYTVATSMVKDKPAELRERYEKEKLSGLDTGAKEWRDRFCGLMRLEQLRMEKEVQGLEQEVRPVTKYEDSMAYVDKEMESISARVANCGMVVKGTAYESCQTWDDFLVQVSESRANLLVAEVEASKTSGATQVSKGTKKKNKKRKTAAQRAKDKEIAAKRAQEEEESSDSHHSTPPSTIPDIPEDDWQREVADHLGDDWEPVRRNTQRKRRGEQSVDISERKSLSVLTDPEDFERVEEGRREAPEQREMRIPTRSPVTCPDSAGTMQADEVTEQRTSDQLPMVPEEQMEVITEVQNESHCNPKRLPQPYQDSVRPFRTDREIVQRGADEEVTEERIRQWTLDKLMRDGLIGWGEGGIGTHGETYFGGYMPVLPSFFADDTESSQRSEEE